MKPTTLSSFGGAKETTYGTAVAEAWSLPFKNPNIRDEYEWIKDEGMRAQPAGPAGVYQGVVVSELEWEGDFYPTDTPNLVMGVMGADTVTGAGDPWSHAVKLVQGQPPSYTLTDQAGKQVARQYAGCVIHDLALKFTPEEGLTYSAGATGLKSATGSLPTEAYTAEPEFLGWQASLTIAGSGNAKMTGFEVDLKRAVDPVFVANASQSPVQVWAGPLSIMGKLSVYWDDDTDLSRYLNASQQAFVLTIDRGVSPLRQMILTMTLTAFEHGAINRGKTYIECDIDFEAIINATDGSATVMSPGQWTFKNGKSSAY